MTPDSLSAWAPAAPMLLLAPALGWLAWRGRDAGDARLAALAAAWAAAAAVVPGAGWLGAALALAWAWALGVRARTAPAALRRGLRLLGLACALAFGAAWVMGWPLPWWACGVVWAVLATVLLAQRLLQGAQEVRQLQAERDTQLAQHHTELRQALEQMRQSRDALAAADQAKTRLLAAASHDLRQPVHALGLYMATLRATALPLAQAEVAERMATTLTALESMFARLLDLSRLDAGAVAPRWDLVPLAPLLRRLADEFAAPAEARGLRLALRIADERAVSATDALLLERVLRNLLANAVKYTQQGGVLLALRRRGAAGASGAERWRIEVWDSGPGIAAADRERVFEEFWQAGRGGAGGLGLGLAIVRGLVQVLGLQLTLHSRPGRGSVFFVDGLAPAGEMPQAAAAARAAMQRTAGACVALIEDDDAVRDATQRLLEQWGCVVWAGRDAAEVLAAAGSAPADAVVADLHLLQGRSGPVEAGALAAAWGRSPPLLLVSADAAALQAAGGGHTRLPKPLSPARLRAWLESALRPGAAHGSTEEPPR